MQNALSSNNATPLIEQAIIAESLEDVRLVLRKFCERVELEHFIYGALVPASLVKPDVLILNGYPPDWREHYEMQSYLSVDPTVRHCRSRSVPINWQELSSDPATSSKKAVQCLCEARDVGLVSGVSVPLHGVGAEWGMISVAGRGSGKPSVSKSISDELSLLAPHVHEAVKRTTTLESEMLVKDDQTYLTAREKEVLLWSSEGKTTSDVALILNIRERTVTFHLQNTLKKLNVCNRTHAVARAISLGLINPIL